MSAETDSSLVIDAPKKEATKDRFISNAIARQIFFGALMLALGTVIGFLISSLPVRSRVPVGGSLRNGFLTLLGIGSLTWYACALSSPLYFWLARRYPIDRKRWPTSLPLHILVTAAILTLTSLIYYLLLAPPPEARANLKFFLLIRLITESLPFAAMIAAIHAIEFYRRYREREMEALRLEAKLAESRLESLTAQLRPHFLFNTLQGISTLMHRDVQAADAMLSGLSDLLRQTLRRGDRQEVTLREEMEVLRYYIEISCERFKDRLAFDARISPEAEDARVPFFILQPLVENALEHGIARRAGAGRIEIVAQRSGSELQLSISDDGPGLEAGRAFPREGIGLANTRERLNQLYGDRHILTLESSSEGGLRVLLIIPYRKMEEADR
ncbi:MAG TPA: histidine kinase [Blastocatellia bacterium]